MKKGILGMLMVSCLAMVLIAGCGAGNPGGGPNPTPTPEQWPAATTDWLLSDLVPLTVPSSPCGAITGMSTKSDGTYLYVKVTFATPVQGGLNMNLVIDDKSLTSGYDCNVWTANWGVWWGDMGMYFLDGAGNPFFDMDFSLINWRGGDGSWGTDMQAKAFNDTGADTESSTRDVKTSIEVVDAVDHSSYEFKIPYSCIGTGALAGHHLQIAVMIGKNTYTGVDEPKPYFLEGTYNNTGIKSLMPGNGSSVITDTSTDPDVVRIRDVKTAVRCTLSTAP